LIDTIKAGQPTAIFEDPFPRFVRAPATSLDFGPNRPKCDIRRLWEVLGIEMIGEKSDDARVKTALNTSVIFQGYNPYPIVQNFAVTPEFVFASPDAPGARPEDAISIHSSITSGLDQLLFAYPGAIRNDESKGMNFESLVTTGNEATGMITWSGVQQAEQILSQNENAMRDLVYAKFRNLTEGVSYCLAAKITGEAKETALSGIFGPGAAKDSKQGGQVNVVFVADADLMASNFLIARAKPDGVANWQFDNVPFVLNILDHLAGDERLIEIRKRQPRHSTLKMVNRATESARDEFANDKDKFDKMFQAEQAKAQATIQQKVEQIQAELAAAEKNNDQAEIQRLQAKFRAEAMLLQRKQQTFVERMNRERDSTQKKIERTLNQRIISVQNFYKALAVCLPPIPPLIVGLIVFWKRRQRELVGVIDERLRSV